MKKNNLYILLSFLFALLYYSTTTNADIDKSNAISKLSISSDGRYVISTTNNHHAYLWDIKQRTYHEVGRYPVDSNSAYFIKGADKFMLYENRTHKVVIQDVKGHVIKRFNPGFVPVAHVITQDLSYYFAADRSSHVHRIHNGKKEQLNKPWWCEQGKYNGYPATHSCIDGHLALLLTQDDTNLIALLIQDASTPSQEHLIVWNVVTGEGTKSHTHNVNGYALSPDDRYLLISGNQELLYGYLLDTGFELANLESIGFGQGYSSYFPHLTEHTPRASTIINNGGCVKFIDLTHYIIFFDNGLVSLYSTNTLGKTNFANENENRPIKNMSLHDKDNNMLPIGIAYSSATESTVATAPTAGILVLARYYRPGITVFQFDADKQTFKKIWQPYTGPDIGMVKRSSE